MQIALENVKCPRGLAGIPIRNAAVLRDRSPHARSEMRDGTIPDFAPLIRATIYGLRLGRAGRPGRRKARFGCCGAPGGRKFGC